jgi:hypothetical protein
MYLSDVNNIDTLTFASSHFNASGTMYVSTDAFPGAKAPIELVLNYPTTPPGDGNYNIDEIISAQPEINGNNALHTVVFYTENFVGSITIQATIDSQLITDNTTDWTTIGSPSFNNEIGPIVYNFNGMYTYLRFKFTSTSPDQVTKILVKN